MAQIRSWIVLSALAVSLLLSSSPAQAFFTEVGASYGRDKKTFDSNNYLDTESITASLSFYFWERVALELSYTDATALRTEKASPTDAQRNILQKSQIIGADLIWMLADRKDFFQPFVKGGGAQVSRRQQIDIEGFGTQVLSPETAIVPSYGFGLKLMITDSFSIKFSYNLWQTPIDGGQRTDDSSLKAGVSWIF
jgi:hypothetical protein